MKWGVRRFQKKDGTLTNAGKKRYSEDSNKPQKQTKQDKYYEKYKTDGYNDKKARELAAGRVKLERTLKIVGGVAATAVVAYAGYKIYDHNMDRFITPNKAIQTVHVGDISERIRPGNPFYASYTKADNTIYSSKVFSHFTDQSKITRMYTKDGIKVAGPKTGKKVFEEVLRENPEISDYIKAVSGGRELKGSRTSSLYKKFNQSLVLRTDPAKSNLDHDKMHNLFYDKLRQKGYGAVMDLEDSKIESFTFNPVIVFDKQIKQVISTTPATARDLGAFKTARGATYAMTREMLNNPVQSPVVRNAALMGATTTTALAISARNYGDPKAAVANYRLQHPNTKMTDKEILKSLN